MTRSATIAIAASCCIVAVALTQPNGSSRAATSAALPSPVVSVTTLPALPSPGVATAHPVAPPSAVATSGPLPSDANASPLGSLHATPTAPPATIAPPPPGTLITITGNVAHPMTISLDQLHDMHKTSVTMRVVDADGKHRFHTFSGTPLKVVLNLAGPTNPGGISTSMNAYVLITGLSGGPAVVAFPEFENDYANKLVLLAYQVDFKPTKIGSVMLVVDGDSTVGRFVQGVTSIQVVQVGP